MSKFKLGDTVWIATSETVEERVTCPDCMGKKYLTVIMGDDSRVTIDCANCAPGFEYPRGYIILYNHIASVRQVIIDGIEENTEETWYRFEKCRTILEQELFVDKEGAESRAAELVQERNDEEKKRLITKEKHNHTWAWNATYHRRCIKQAEENIIYHTAKLEAAKQYVREVTNDTE